MGRIRRELRVELGREPSAEELAAILDVEVEKVEDLVSVSREPVSLDRQITDDGGTELLDLVADTNVAAPDQVVLHGQLQRDVDGLLEVLDSREAAVVAYRFGLIDGREHTLAEIGNRMALSRERIRQLERHALVKLREQGNIAALKDYLAS